MYSNAQGSMPQTMAGQTINAADSLSEIAREHQKLRESVESLSDAVSALCGGLQPVVRQVPQPDEGIASTKGPECYSQLGQGINDVTHGIRSQVQRLRDLLQSLAV